MIRGFLFDLGGTLFHYRGHTEADLFRLGSERSYLLLKESYGLRRDYATYYRLVSRGFLRRWYWALLTGREIQAGRLFGRLAGPLGIPLTMGCWHTIEKAWHDPAGECVQLLEGALDLLAALEDRGVRLGVISNTIWRGEIVLGMLEQLGIRSFFDTFTFSSDLGYRKPHRWIYMDALRKLGLPRSSVGYVGNQFREDVRGPQRHGMRAIYLSGKEAHLPFFTPRHQARSLGEVKEIALSWC